MQFYFVGVSLAAKVSKMTPKQATQFNRMLYVLNRICKEYMTVEEMNKNAEKMYGLSSEEALEMAYENIQYDAKAAINGVRKIKLPVKK